MNIPYLSIIIVGRNDNYGENFLLRINTFIRSLDFNLKNYPDLVELIVVEWNPIEGYEPLKQVLHKPKNMSFRIITVPNRIHELIGAPFPVLEFYGKNVGIRRSTGEFVLITNPDILFTQQLINRFAQKNLDLNTIYRTDRYDYAGEGIEHVPDEGLTNFAVANTFTGHICVNNQTIALKFKINNLEDFPKTVITNNQLHTNACGDFILASKEMWFKTQGMWETLHQRWHLDSFSLYRLASFSTKQHIFTTPECIFHMDHKRKPEDVLWNQNIADSMLTNPFIADTDKQIYWGLKDFDLPEWKPL
jgi:hypothetical protein